MEVAGDGEKKKPPEGGEVNNNNNNKSKRKMKTASQLQILENTYAVETYPSEELRAELSAQLGLTDRQLQMWFCHRRLKDRKGPPPTKRQRKDETHSQSTMPVCDIMGVPSDVRNEVVPLPAAGSATSFGLGMDSRRVVPRTPGVAVARISSDLSAVKRYYDPQQSIAELRAIAFVEAQLGESLREDGPILGMEFDPLPPDAFGAPIGTTTVAQQKYPGRSFEANLYERSDVKNLKAPARPMHEYQFLPAQPTVREDAYERDYHYGPPPDSHNNKTASISTARQFMHANEQVSSGYGLPSQLPSLNLMPQEGRQGNLFPSATGEYDTVLRKSSSIPSSMEAHPAIGLDNPFIPSDRRVAPDEEALRIERKRKSEEARIAREVEAHERRIRKELEKQDILRRKREEQLRKEMERQDRERRKEEERLLREKQREEERYLREQRRELERRERFLQKESIRAEKMRQKEEQRREKEAERQKAATKRAIARRIAKESLELVDDERLELMELATSSKGLPSVLSLDFETLQNFDSFRDKLAVFPAKSVQLKKPFSIQPWSDSEENVGNLLMVWRFLVTFADVLGIWPFTLDEFVQAFHDFDPRLFGEIHIALLRTIIKDIEDVARTPSAGPGPNQNTAANPGGGHPQIVEGAFAWGFDIRSWQRHLNPLTWPEILRQLALSAGFGPQLKKRNIEQASHRDENEGNDGEDVITNLRSGAAVENAVAIMQERGFSNPRRSRHRLTPGTVKFAAFHVLSLEGSRGLTILEVAEKIQKSGLRDLTTSKTPEASISAALSRDSRLFERTAPSTYCVRPSYRKDPADAEAILSAARERVRMFKSGYVDGEDADDAERDEDSESDVADDPDVDDLGTDLNLKAEVYNSPELDTFSEKTHFENGNESADVLIAPQVKSQNVGEGLPSTCSNRNNEVKDVGACASMGHFVDIAGVPISIRQEDADIDESNLGEPWVQGLVEGEYSDLSVEERLNALVALIGVAIEGNSVRLALEERLEAANALKKQMWTEAQLDKRRMKEEYVMKMHYPSFAGSKMEPNLAMSTTPEARQSPLVAVNERSNEMSVNTGAKQEQSNDPQSDLNCANNIASEANQQIQDLSAGPDNLLYMQPGLIADKSRSQMKSFIGHKAEEMYVYRSLPLGQDRRRNRYWQFTTSYSSNDPGCGRIFVELHGSRWRIIDSAKGFDSLLTSLDVRGVRESHLHMMLQKVEMSFKEAVRRKMSSADVERQSGDTVEAEYVDRINVPDFGTVTDSPSSTLCGADSDASETSASFSIEVGRNDSEKNHALRRYQDFETWMWKECYNSLVLRAMKYGKKRTTQLLSVCDYCREIYFTEKSRCLSCMVYQHHGSDLNFSKHVAEDEEKPSVGLDYNRHESTSPLRIRLLKMQLALIEVCLLQDALQPFWTDNNRISWGTKLQSSLSAEDLLKILTLLEGSIKRDYLSSNFETTSELLGSKHPSECAIDSSQTENFPLLPWLPRTTAAVALRAMELDSSISYMLHQNMESQKDSSKGDAILPSKFASMRNTQDNEVTRTHKAGLFQGDDWTDLGTGSGKLARGRGSRGRSRNRNSGLNCRRKAGGSRSESGRKNMTTSNYRSEQVLSWKGQPSARGGRKQGRRSVRSRQKPVKRADVTPPTNLAKEIIYKKVRMNLERDDWNANETRYSAGPPENDSSSERSEYEENGQGTGDEYDDLVPGNYTGGYKGKSDDLLDGSEYNMDLNEEDYEEDEDEDEAYMDEGDLEVGGYRNGDSGDDGIGEGDREQNGDPDEEIGSSSSDFSD